MKTFKNIKTWKNVANPNIFICFLQFLFASIPSVCIILTSIPNAKAITSLLVYDYDKVVYYLTISLFLSIIYAISWHIQYRLDTAQLKHIYPKIQKQVFDKIFTADDVNFMENSKEKMVNIISNNITELSDFCDFSATKFACFLEFCVLISIIFSNNLIVGFIMLSVAVLVFLLIKISSRLIAKKDIALFNTRDKLSETFAEIVDNRIISQDYNLKENLHTRYFDNVNSILSLYKNRTRLKSFRDNFVYLLYSVAIFFATIYLARLAMLDKISTTLYLVIVPYLTSSVQKIVCFCNISSDIENCTISALRVKTLLSMSSTDLISFGQNTAIDIDGALTFSWVSYNSENKPNKTLGSIKPFFAQILKNEFALFQGNRNCGKRAIFYMLRRAIRPDTGTITLDTINIFDFSQNTYISNIAYLTSKPQFYNGSIINNFKLIESSKQKIIFACKQARIHNKIMTLPNTYQTNLNDKNAFTIFEKFQLSLARALLTNSDVLLIYEIPVGITPQETQLLKDILKTLKKTKTIIMFSANNLFPDLLNKHYKIKNQTLTEQPLPNQPAKKNIIVNSKFSK